MGWLDAMLGWNTIPQVNLPPVETPVANALQGYVGIVEPSTPDLTIPHNPGNTPILDAGQASMPNTGNIPASAIPDVGQVARETQASQEATTSPWVEDTPHHGNSEGAPAETQLPTVTLPVSFPDIEKARDVGVASPYDSKDNVIHKDPNPPTQIETPDDNVSSQEGSVVPATVSQGEIKLEQYIQETQTEYESARQSVIHECDAFLNSPLTPTEAERYQALKQVAEDNPDLLKSFINVANGTSNVAGWTEGVIEAFLDPQLHTTTDQAAFAGASFDHMRATEADQVALYEGRHAAEAKTAAYKQALDSYDPKAADAESAKATLKKLSDANNEYKKNLTRTWAKVQAKKVATTPKIEDYRMTLSQQFAKAAGTSTEFISDANSYGNGKALANGIKKMSKIQAAGIVFHTAGLAYDVYEHWDDLEYALITKDDPMIDKLKNLKSNVSQDTWNTFVEDTIDTAVLAVDLFAGATLTPLGGAALGVFVLHPLGALAKTVYYKNEYGDDVDFGKTFLENLKLGNHDHFVLKSQDNVGTENYLNDLATLTLSGHVEEVEWLTLTQDDNFPYSAAQNIVLNGYVNDTTLKGEVEDILLNGSVEYPHVVNPNDGFVVHGDDVYNPVGNPPPTMFPDTDVSVCQAANGCVSVEESEPDIGLVPCTPADPADECVSEPELPPDIQLANDVDVFVPPDHNRAYDVAIVTPKTVKGSELVTTEPSWPSVNEISAIDEYVIDENLCAPPDLGTPSALIGPSFYELPERDFAAEPMTIFASVGSIRDIGIVGPNKNQW